MDENPNGNSNKNENSKENNEIDSADGAKSSQKQNQDQEKPKNDNESSETEKTSILKNVSQDNDVNQQAVKTNKPKKKKKLILVVVLLFVIALGGAGLFVFKNKKQAPTVKTPVSENTQKPQEQKSQKVNTNELQDVKFQDNPQEIAYIPLFKEKSLLEEFGIEDINTIKSQFKFYKIGTANKSDELILVEATLDGPGNPVYFMILKKGDKYKYILSYSNFFDTDDNNKTYNGPELNSNVEVDSETVIAELKVRDTITYNNISASLVPNTKPEILYISEQSKVTEVAKIENGVVYEQIYENEHHPGVKQFAILLKQPTGLYLVYRYTTDVLKDDNSVTINYKDGKTSTEKYNWAMVKGGCGVVDSVNVVDKAYFNDLTEIGKVGDEPIYGFKSANHQVVNTIYEAYNLGGVREGAVSQEQFWKDNGVVVVRNKLGYRVILVNEKYQAEGECGKPVIYLYPQHKIDIKVKVGADITVSDPAYDTGWDVTAFPNGQIFNKKDGKTYPYLFWEGKGHGFYPTITEGFIVKRSEAEKTMWAHLAKLGLNQQESKDFMDFWAPKLPNKPYVRLTWFNTNQMDRLAPLDLSVKPDTTIRVFLDFQGLDKPYNLKLQELTHKPRNGFTLVEWGGLLYK